MSKSMESPTKKIDWEFRIRSICNFCKNYNNSPVLRTGTPESVVINNRLSKIAAFLNNDLDGEKFDFSFSKGSGTVPKAPWVAINIKGRRVSNSISFVICFARTGEGIVLGLMSPSSFKSSIPTIERTKSKANILIDYKDKNKYDDRFINPIELKFDDITIEKIQSHKHISCEKLLKDFITTSL